MTRLRGRGCDLRFNFTPSRFKTSASCKKRVRIQGVSWPQCENGTREHFFFLLSELTAAITSPSVLSVTIGDPIFNSMADENKLKQMTSLFPVPCMVRCLPRVIKVFIFVTVFDSSRRFIWRDHRRKGSQPDW